jgi:hypothetical protein
MDCKSGVEAFKIEWKKLQNIKPSDMSMNNDISSYKYAHDTINNRNKFFILACIHNIEIVKYLLEEYDDLDLKTGFQHASSIDIYNLLYHKQLFNSQKKIFKESVNEALYNAILKNNKELINHLLNNNKLLITKKECNRALLCAYKNGNLELIEKIIKLCKHRLTIRINKNDLEIIKLLETFGNIKIIIPNGLILS